MKLRRYEGNPILKPRGDDWESIEVYNPAAVYIDGKIHLLFRATGEYTKYVSRLGHAIFDEDLNLVERFDEPCFLPDLELWELSVEDARLTPLGRGAGAGGVASQSHTGDDRTFRLAGDHRRSGPMSRRRVRTPLLRVRRTVAAPDGSGRARCKVA